MSPYHALGVTEVATDQEIRDAYMRLLREHPPESEPEQFRIIQQAYTRIRLETDRLQHAVLGSRSDEQPPSLEQALLDHCVYATGQPFPSTDTFRSVLRHQLLS